MPLQVFLAGCRSEQKRRASKTCRSRLFDPHSLRVRELDQQMVELLVSDRVTATQQSTHQVTHEARWPCHSQAIGLRAHLQTDIVDRDTVVTSGQHPEELAGRLDRLRKEAVDTVSEHAP